jgi:hypothetical protein
MENINSVIDNLCLKLGTTVENLLPELIRYKRVGVITDVIIFGIAQIVFIFICKRFLIKMIPTESDEAGVEALKILGLVMMGLTGIITPICLLVSIHELVIWVVSPEGAAIEYILRLLH